ncbi:MAG: sugar phosphate isomerase/epimerase [Clostridiales bacterium]|jgi:sugar phosphate isomerase/epimerase|nr:sugar phosphate isomerase/epimerase [Clostridiales bacterium]
MRIGVCTSAGNVQMVEDMGFDYVEPSVVGIAEMNDNDFARIVDMVGRSGIKCEAFNVLFPRHIKLTGSEVDMDEIKSYLEKAFGRISVLGAEVVVLGSGGSRRVPDDYSLDNGWKQLVEVTGAIGDVAARYDLAIAVEPLNRDETNIINSVEEGIKFVKDVGHPNIKLTADFYHMRRENEPMHILTEAGGYVAHLHIANSNGRVYPMKPAEDIYVAFFDALKKAGYQGRVSIEGGTKDLEKDGPIALSVLRDLLK